MTPAQITATTQLQTLTKRQHVHLTGRGTAGIFAILRAAGFLAKDVLIPANTCYIVAWAVIASGNRPRLVDIDPVTGNVTPSMLEAARTPTTAAIIPCHLYGIPAPMAEICAWANTHQLLVIEDAALAVGNQAGELPCGAWGDASILSFGLGKTIDIELGGAVLTDNAPLSKEISRVLKSLPLWSTSLYKQTRVWNDLYWALHRCENDGLNLDRQYAALFQQFHEIAAYQLPASYWDDLPAALADLKNNLAHRRKLAEIYSEALKAAPVQIQQFADLSALWKYPVFVARQLREDVLDTLWNHGHHEVTCWYPSLHPMVASLLPNINQPPTPCADAWGAEVINLPLSSNTTEIDARAIAKMLAAAIEQG